jgi:hypothetical protein
MGAARFFTTEIADGFHLRFVVAHQDHRVRQVRSVRGADHLAADQALMGSDQQRRDSRLTQVRQQLMQMMMRKLLGHGIEVAVQAVDDHHRNVSVIHGAADGMSELSRRKLGRIDLLNRNASLVEVFPQVDSKPAGPAQQGAGGSSKMNKAALLPRAASAATNCARATTCRSPLRRRSACWFPFEATAEQRIQLSMPLAILSTQARWSVRRLRAADRPRCLPLDGGS